MSVPRLVRNIRPGSLSPLPNNLTAVGSTLFFTADDGRSGRALWKSNGTAAGTVLVKDLRADQKNPFEATGSGPLGSVLGNALVFPAVDRDFDFSRGNLWISDGTQAGTRLLKEGLFAGDPWVSKILNFDFATPPRDFTRLPALGGALFFPADDKPLSVTSVGTQLWKTDGTAVGTKVVKDLPTFSPSGFKSAFPEFPTIFKNKVFFLAAEELPVLSSVRNSDLSLRVALWKTDGSKAGTIRVDSLNNAFDLIVSGNTLFFTAVDTTAGRELWKSDGTAAGTFLLKDINPVATRSSGIKNFTDVNGTLFFTADDGIHGRELWISDGTEAGTKLLKDITPTGRSSSGPRNLTAVGRKLFFTNESGLWVSDGTESGTVFIKTINFNGGVAAGNTLFFTATSPDSGEELWKSDGTAAGTQRLTDLNPGASSSSPQGLTLVGSTLYFTADDGTNGRELWALDDVVPPPPPRLVITAVLANRPEGSGVVPTPFTFRVNRSGSSTGVSTVVWGVTGTGSNRANAADFNGGVLPSGTLTFAAGETSKTITVEVAADSTVEADEDFRVSLSAPTGATLGTAATTGTIRNDDTGLAITPLHAAKGEGRNGPTPFTFTVNRTGVRSGRSTAAWVLTGSGTNPTDGADFIGGTSGIVTFLPGQSNRTITINVRGDILQEGDESFEVSLSAPTGAALTTATATSTLLNDDLIGDAAANTLVGTARPEFIDGGANLDTLTGRGAADVFAFRFGESPLNTPDVITDFAFGVDRIDMFSPTGAALPAPVRFSRAVNNASAPTLGALAAAVFADANGALPGNQALGANGAVLVRSTNAAIAGTYLVVNNGVAGRSLTDDVMVKLNGSSGALPALGVSPVSSVFF